MLRFHQIHHRYPGAVTPALRGVDLEVRAGEALGLLGPNGAGKTTLMSLAAGLLEGQGGEITLDGLPLRASRAWAEHKVALVPQDNAFYPMLTVAENLAFFGRVQGLGGRELPERTAAVLATTRLEEELGKRASHLSGGFRRRLNLAIGLLADPWVLLLDEPTAGVDPQSRRFLLDVIGEMRASGRTIVYTTHHMDEVEAVCGRVAILDQGRVLASGTLGEVLALAPPALTLRLSGPLDAALEAEWTARFGLRALPGHRYRLTGVGSEGAADLLAKAGVGAGVEAWSWGQQHLDDVFLSLTDRPLEAE